MDSVIIHTSDFGAPRICPECGGEFEQATGIGRPEKGLPMPKPGDATICVYCCAYLCFMPGLTLRRMTDEEFNTLPKTQRALMKGMKETFSRPSVRARFSGIRRAQPAQPRKG